MDSLENTLDIMPKHFGLTFCCIWSNYWGTGSFKGLNKYFKISYRCKIKNKLPQWYIKENTVPSLTSSC